jgi:hypothetical protein
MKMLQLVGVVVGAVALCATAAGAQTTVEGQVQAVTVHCSGAAPETCGGTVDVVTGVGSGNITTIIVPEGKLLSYGGRQVPITALAVGDYVRFDYTTTTTALGDATVAFNTASNGVIVAAPGAVSIPAGEDPMSSSF